MERIDKILASRGVKSRNEASKLLQQGRVQVNGRVVRGRGDKFLSDAKIRISSVELPPLPVLVGYHKPLGVLSSIGDPWNRPNLSQVIDDHKDLLGQMHPVGRLDQDTTGLLLFSRDGDLTNSLLDPLSCIEREYEALVTGQVNFDDLFNRLRMGVETQLGKFTAHLLEAQCNPESSFVRVMVAEGKNRMVRRILHNSGHSVLSLRRVRYGQILLGDLPEGACRPISDEEFQWLVSLFHK